MQNKSYNISKCYPMWLIALPATCISLPGSVPLCHVTCSSSHSKPGPATWLALANGMLANANTSIGSKALHYWTCSLLPGVITRTCVLASLLEAERHITQSQVAPALQVNAILDQPTANQTLSQNQQSCLKDRLTQSWAQVCEGAALRSTRCRPYQLKPSNTWAT